MKYLIPLFALISSTALADCPSPKLLEATRLAIEFRVGVLDQIRCGRKAWTDIKAIDKKYREIDAAATAAGLHDRESLNRILDQETINAMYGQWNQGLKTSFEDALNPYTKDGRDKLCGIVTKLKNLNSKFLSIAGEKLSPAPTAETVVAPASNRM